MAEKQKERRNTADGTVLFRMPSTRLEKILIANNAPKVLLVAFLFVILCGSVLLSLPAANRASPAAYIDNLFEAVSAVCVTGLTTVVPASQYNLFGKIVLIILMQIGGLGPMTIIAVLMQSRKQRMAMAEKKFFAAASGKSDLANVPQYIRRIVYYTAAFELCGFILLSLKFIPEYGTGEGLFNALFLAVSAFTNAGFDCLGAESLAKYAADPAVNLIIMTLIVFGGLGFMVWFELSDLIRRRFRQKKGLLGSRTYLSVHASTVLRMTGTLLVSGTIFFWLLESRNTGTIGLMDAGGKLLASMFQSVTLRTAGFSTINIGMCTRPVLIIMCLFMLIGGSPGGTAGGMKTTTAAVLYVSAVNTLDDRQDEAVIRRRSISYDLLKQAFVILYLYVFILFSALIILSATEVRLDFLAVVFEAFSAIGTVGISTGITGQLTVAGRLVIMALMFVGRLGPLSVYMAFHKEKKTTKHITYPDADIIIG